MLKIIVIYWQSSSPLKQQKCIFFFREGERTAFLRSCVLPTLPSPLSCRDSRSIQGGTHQRGARASEHTSTVTPQGFETACFVLRVPSTQVQEHGVLASSLLLLADSHAARAEKGAIRLR